MNNVIFEAGAAIYVAMAVALAVWLGIFAYLWRIDAQARALKRELERDQAREPRERDEGASVSVTRLSRTEDEPIGRQ